MITIHRAIKNIIAILTGDISSKILAAVTTIILARYLGPEDYGKYCSVFSFVYIFIVIADFGLNDLIIRDVARNNSLARQYLATSIIIKIIFSFASMMLLILSVHIMGYSQEIILYVAVLSTAIIFITFCNSISSIFKALERMQYSSLILVINSLFFLVFIAALAYFKGTLLQIFILRVMALCFGSVIGFILIVKLIAKPDFAISRTDIKIMTASAFPFLAVGLIHAVYFNLDIIMLSKMKGPVYVGWFAPAANDLFFSLFIIPAAISTVTYPIFSRHYDESVEKFRESFNFTLKILAVLGVAIGFGTFVLAPEIIYFIFGLKYENSIIILQIIAIAIPFAFIRDSLGYGWAAIGKVKTLMWLNIVGLGLNAVLNLILIPFYAHIGAAVASVVCIFMSFLFSYYLLNREVNHLNILTIFIKPVIAALIMCLAICLFNSLHVLIVIGMGAVVYFISLLTLKTFSGSEITLLKKSIKRV